MTQSELDADLSHAAEKNTLQVHYQPIISLESGSITGFEALARWKRHGHYVPPRLFIHAAEKSNLIIAIGEHILRNACQQLKKWQESGLFSHKQFLSVNLSGKQLINPGFAGRIENIITAIGVNGQNLHFEITDNTTLDNPEIISANLFHLKSLGISCSVDNFKNDKTSVEFLRQLPFDILKVDRSFMVTNHQNIQDQIRKLRAIILQAHRLGLIVVAEGVEDEHLLQQLREMDCEYAQGFYFSPPVSAHKAGQILAGDPQWRRVLH